MNDFEYRDKPKKSHYGLIITACIIALVLIGFVLFVQNRNSSIQKQIEVELAKIKQRGDPLTLNDLYNPRYAPDDNGGLIYETIFPDADRLNIELFKSELIKSDFYKITDEEIRIAKEKLKNEQALFDTVLEAQTKPGCRITTNWNDGINVLFPHLSKMRTISKLTNLKAIIYASEGNPKAASDMMIASFRLQEALKDDKYEMCFKSRNSLISSSISALLYLLNMNVFNDSQLKGIDDYLKTISFKDDVKNVIIGDNVLWLDLFNKIETGKTSVSLVSSGVKNDNLDKLYMYIQYNSGKLKFLQSQNKAIELSNKSYREIMLTPAYSEIAEDKLIDPFLFVLTTSNYSLFWHHDNMITSVNAARILIHLQLYKRQFGNYPDSLDELKTKLNFDPPKDVFTDAPYHYRKEGNGVILYSVGENLKDDGGAAKDSENPSTTENNDLVWRLNPR